MELSPDTVVLFGIKNRIMIIIIIMKVGALCKMSATTRANPFKAA